MVHLKFQQQNLDESFPNNPSMLIKCQAYSLQQCQAYHHLDLSIAHNILGLLIPTFDAQLSSNTSRALVSGIYICSLPGKVRSLIWLPKTQYETMAKRSTITLIWRKTAHVQHKSLTRACICADSRWQGQIFQPAQFVSRRYTLW